MKDDAIVLVDALDIMRSLPTEMQRDDDATIAQTMLTNDQHE